LVAVLVHGPAYDHRWRLLAMLVRWELAWPETPVPGLGFIPETLYLSGEHGGGIIPTANL